MKKLLFLILVVLITSNLFAQSPYQCGTPPMDSVSFMNKPWVGNNQFLLDLVDSVNVENPPSEAKHQGVSLIEGGFDSEVVFWVPVKAWVYNDDNGVGGMGEHRVAESIKRLNEYFAGDIDDNNEAHPHSQIQFYLKCNITYVSNSNFSNDPSDAVIGAMWDINHDKGAMNIHYVQTLPGILAGKGRFPGGNKSFACVIESGWENTGVLAHEVGHALDLQHTHQGRPSGDNRDASPCKQEAVSRAKHQGFGCQGWFPGKKTCEVNGDGYCDTEADPNIDGQVRLNPLGDWVYDGGGQDHWNNDWNPNVHNIMSYTEDDLREYFSPMQIGTMYWWIIGLPNGSYEALNNRNSFVDVYEPDNGPSFFSEELNFGITQRRGLHPDHNGSANNSTLS